MKKYLILVALVMFFLASFGWVLPFLLSADSTLLLATGVLYILLAMPGAVYWAYKHVVPQLTVPQPLTKE